MKNKKYYAMYISAMMIFGTIGIFRKYVPIPSGLLACLRGFLGAGFLLVVMAIGRKKFDRTIGKRNFVLLAISGALIGANWALLFESYSLTSVPVATLCYYMAPTLIIVLSTVLLKEKMTLLKAICCFLAVLGMVLVSGVLETGFKLDAKNFIGILLGLAAALIYAIVVILNKKMDVKGTTGSTIIQLVSASIAVLPYVLFIEKTEKIQLDFVIVLLTLVIGIVHTGLSYLLYFGGLSKLSGQSVALFSYIDPVFALLLSWLVLGEKLSQVGIIGAALIVGSAIMGELSNKK